MMTERDIHSHEPHCVCACVTPKSVEEDTCVSYEEEDTCVCGCVTLNSVETARILCDDAHQEAQR